MGKQEANIFKNRLKELKAIREKADYEMCDITYDMSEKAIKSAKEIRGTIIRSI